MKDRKERKRLEEKNIIEDGKPQEQGNESLLSMGVIFQWTDKRRGRFSGQKGKKRWCCKKRKETIPEEKTTTR